MSTPALDPRLRAWRGRVFAATWLSYFGFYFARKPFYVAKADLGAANGWDAGVLGNIGAAYLVAYAVGQFSTGVLGARFGPRAIVLSGMALSALANAAFGFTDAVLLFTVLMAVNGLAQATGWPSNVGTMATWFHRGERGTVMGFWATNFQFGGLAATTLAAFVLDAYGLRMSFLAGSAVLCLIWVFYWFNQRNKPEDLGLSPVEDALPTAAEAEAASARPAPSKWAFYLNVLLVGGFYFNAKVIRYAIWSWAPYLLRLHFGMEKGQAGYLTNVFDFSGILGVVLIGYLSDRLFKSRRVLVSFLFVIGLVLSCLLLYFFGSTSLTLFTVSMGLIGFTLIAPDSIMTGAGAIDVGSREQATLAVGLIGTLGALGSVFQELVLGQLLKGDDVQGTFTLLLGSAVAAAGCLGLILVRNRLGHSDL
jgi:sugar phosphate permease